MAPSDGNLAFIEIKGLKKHFYQRPSFVNRHLFKAPTRVVRAVDGIDLTIYKGETLGLVGESGCGKSTLGRTLVGLYSPTGGEITYLFNGNGRSRHRGRLPIQMIFQNPYSSLNPRHSVRQIIGTALALRGVPLKEREEETLLLLKKVGLKERHLDQYPRQFSGGQRQRIAVARALAVQPEFIVADEPLSSLDVSVQAQVVNLLEDLQKELGLTYLLISHDLSVVHHLSRRIAVMYMGKIVEIAPSDEIFENPLHPYTKILLSAIPRIGGKSLLERRQSKVGKRGNLGPNFGEDFDSELPSTDNQASGCAFWDRCPVRMPECKDVSPPETIYSQNEKMGQKGAPGTEHVVFCHKYA